MRIKLTLLTLALLAAPSFAQNPAPVTNCTNQAAMQCEANRIASVLGCMLGGRQREFCEIDAQGEYLNCLEDAGCK